MLEIRLTPKILGPLVSVMLNPRLAGVLYREWSVQTDQRQRNRILPSVGNTVELGQFHLYAWGCAFHNKCKWVTEQLVPLFCASKPESLRSSRIQVMPRFSANSARGNTVRETCCHALAVGKWFKFLCPICVSHRLSLVFNDPHCTAHVRDDASPTQLQDQ